MTDGRPVKSWSLGLTLGQRERATVIASRPAPRGMAIDDLTATMIRAGPEFHTVSAQRGMDSAPLSGGLSRWSSAYTSPSVMAAMGSLSRSG